MKKGVSIAVVLLICVAVVVGLGVLFSSGTYDVLSPKGQIASEQKSILIFTLLLSAVVVIPVYFMLAVFVFRYREGSKKKRKYMPEWSSSKTLEIAWWGIPMIIIAILAVVTWTTSHSLDPYKAIQSDNKAIEVRVVALQWKWLFLYPDYNIATLNYLPVPINTPIHFTLSADAPMSAFWIPALGSQIYAMNGMSSQLNLIADKKGEYRGYSTNINGKGYAGMTFVTDAMSESDFNTTMASIGKSSKTLDEHRYLHLVKPESVTTRDEYKLEDPGLFEHVILKYMSHEHPQSDDEMHKMMDRGAI